MRLENNYYKSLGALALTDGLVSLIFFGRISSVDWTVCSFHCTFPYIRQGQPTSAQKYLQNSQRVLRSVPSNVCTPLTIDASKCLRGGFICCEIPCCLGSNSFFFLTFLTTFFLCSISTSLGSCSLSWQRAHEYSPYQCAVLFPKHQPAVLYYFNNRGIFVEVSECLHICLQNLLPNAIHAFLCGFPGRVMFCISFRMLNLSKPLSALESDQLPQLSAQAFRVNSI